MKGDNQFVNYEFIYLLYYLVIYCYFFRYAKIKLVAGNNVYHYIIRTEHKSLESEKENYLRCHTPNNVVSLSPATSPQSVTSNR